MMSPDWSFLDDARRMKTFRRVCRNLAVKWGLDANDVEQSCMLWAATQEGFVNRPWAYKFLFQVFGDRVCRRMVTDDVVTDWAVLDEM